MYLSSSQSYYRGMEEQVSIAIDHCELTLSFYFVTAPYAVVRAFNESLLNSSGPYYRTLNLVQLYVRHVSVSNSLLKWYYFRSILPGCQPTLAPLQQFSTTSNVLQWVANFDAGKHTARVKFSGCLSHRNTCRDTPSCACVGFFRSHVHLALLHCGIQSL